ncbi:HEAT repeat domain-containing protein [Bacteroidota bacterium]
MRKQVLVTLLLLSGLFIAQPVIAGGFESGSADKSIEANLLVGVNSDNEGLRISSAYYLGELKSEKAVIPLMRMLRQEKVEAARIIAALSLIKIEDPQGLFMVKRTARFNELERVRKMSGQFYNAYLVQKYLEANPDKSDFLADL